MTTLAEAAERIYETFSTDWADATPVAYDGEDNVAGANETWVRLSVRHTARAQESLGPVGGRKFESAGSVIVQCFSPLDSGRLATDTLAETVQSIFEGKVIGAAEQIRFTSAVITEIGSTGDGYYQTNVEAFFAYTQTK